MKISTKGKYGLRAMIDLAQYSEQEAVSISSIAQRQKISESYLEQLVAKLEEADSWSVSAERRAAIVWHGLRQVFRSEMSCAHWREMSER